MLAGYETYDITVVTASGTGQGLSEPVTGRFIQIEYVQDGDAAISDGATFVVEAIRTDGSDVTIFSSVAGDIDDHASFLPEFPTVNSEGAATGNGDFYTLVNETLRFTVSGGGDGKTGVFRVKVAK